MARWLPIPGCPWRWSRSRLTGPPGWTISARRTTIVAIVPLRRTRGSRRCRGSCGDLLTQFRHQVQVLGINLLVPLLRLWVVALTTIARGVSMSTANSTDEVDGDIVNLGTLVLAMAESTTVQARLVLVVSQRSVQ